MEEVVNKVAQSKLEVFDLEDYFPKEEIVAVDIAQWLYEGFILREKEFREALKMNDWQKYSNKNIALFCSTDAILPAWTYPLVTVYLQPFAKHIFQGNQQQLLIYIYQNTLENLDYSPYQDKPVILKGCAKKPVPNEIYTLAIQKLTTSARSIMFGEACSAVPLFKRK